MLFNSYLFLLLFLPVTLAGFFGIGKFFGRPSALLWLIVASLFFYAYWEISCLWLLTGSLLFNYGTSLLITRSSVWKKGITAVAVLANAALLLYFKAIISDIANPDGGVSAAFSTTRDVLIPLGISFITFQQIAFLVDTYKGRIADIGMREYFLFITFFPQLVMGPIVHYRELAPQVKAPHFLRWNPENFALGISVFIVGLFKKVVIADSLAPRIDLVYDLIVQGQGVSPLDAWGVALGFPFQLYFDFSGYADMAVGIARMFNINLPINFDSPYRSTDRFDQWRRWHISFGAFIRQYLFFPLARQKHWPLGNTGALMLTAMFSGAWHGIGSTFLVWGGLQGLIMAFVHHRGEWMKKIRTRRILSQGTGQWMAIALTFSVTVLLSVLFRSSSLDIAFTLFRGMHDGCRAVLSGSLAALVGNGLHLNGGFYRWLCVAALIVWGFPNTKKFFEAYWTALDQRVSPPKYTARDLMPGANRLRFRLNACWAGVMAALFLVAFLNLSKTSRFIYYQF